MIEVFSSKNRLQILKLLSRRDRYVSEIMDLASMDGKNAKHHLDTLEESGLIKSYMVGRKKYYKLIKEVRLEITPPPEGKFILYTTG
ncbi:winged helix-turn-helix domain-containing protein [archaeon]|nr:winged helix-turn-helix domain-containing protein [archaeon]